MFTILLITGASGCGKSTLANVLYKKLRNDQQEKHFCDDGGANGSDNNKNIVAGENNNGINKDKVKISQVRAKVHGTSCIHQDDYFTLPFISYKKRKDLTYESEEGIDFFRMKKDIENMIRNRNSDCDDEESNHLEENVIIVEGHMLGAATEMFYSLFSDETDVGESNMNTKTKLSIITVLIDCPLEKCRERRLTRRNRTKEEYNELRNYFDDYVWKGFVTYGIPAMDALKKRAVKNAVPSLYDHRNPNTNTSSTTTGISEPGRNVTRSSMIEISTEQDGCMEQNVEKIMEHYLQIFGKKR